MTSLTTWLRIAPFAAILIAPVVLTLRLRRRVLQAQESGDVAAGWFAFLRVMRWVGSAVWFAWVGGAVLLDPWWRLGFSWRWNSTAATAFSNAMTVLPPALVLATCEVLSSPVVQRMRGLNIPRGEIISGAFVSRLWLTWPFLWFWTAFAIKGSSEFSLIVPVLMLVGVLGMFLIQFHFKRQLKQNQFVPEALTTGPLRDRAFALAEKAGVELNQVYVFPMARWRLANAYASEGNKLLLTDWLLTHLSAREVDAIIGHELAHMKHRHVSKLTWLLILLILIPVLWFVFRPGLPTFPWAIFGILTVWHLITWVWSALSRRYERQADIDGIVISGDPEAFISGLLRIERLNHVPREFGRFDESFSTHPSTRKRIEAIRRAAGLPDKPVAGSTTVVPLDTSYSKEESLSAPPVPTKEGYTLPAHIEAAGRGEGLIFNSTFKHNGSHRFTMFYVIGIGLIPLGVVRLMAAWPDAQGQWVLLGVGVIFYLAAIILLTDVAARIGMGGLRPKIAARLFGSSMVVGPEHAFVGLSPSPKVRIYENSEHWDLGFLYPDGDRLCYVGEQAQFALTREQIKAIRVGPGMPGWLPRRCVYVDWHNPGENSGGTFHVMCVRTGSFWGDSRKSVQLARDLQQWLASPGATPVPPRIGDDLAPPHFGTVTSKPIKSTRRLSQFVSQCILVLVPALTLIIVSKFYKEDLLLCGLALVGALAGHTFATIPFWRFRED